MVICAACWSLELWQRELAVYVSVIIQSTGQNIVPPRANVYPVLPFSSIKKKNPCNFSGIWDVWYIRKWNLINSGVSSMLPLCRSQIQLFSGWSHESLVSVRTENAENSHVHFQSSLDLMLLFLSVPCFVMSFLFLLWPKLQLHIRQPNPPFPVERVYDEILYLEFHFCAWKSLILNFIVNS
jgi:hypothetical protein